MPNTTRTEVPAEVNNFYDRTLLVRALPLLLHNKWAQVRDIPKNSGTSTIKFRRYGSLSAATTPLSEGITPVGKQLSVSDITATVLQYGDFVTLTDVLQYETEDAVLMETAEILGEQTGDTLDQLTRDILNAGTSLARAAARVSRVTIAAGDVLTSTLVDTALLLLKNNKCRKVTTQIDASTGYNTSPVKASFIAVVHTNNESTIKAFTGFVPVEKYASQQSVYEGEFGYYNEVRFISTTNAKVFTGEGAAGINVYSLILFGQNAYGITRISGEAIKNIIKPLGSAGTADPLEQRATSGWKATHVAKILNNDFITRIEFARV